jgi:hypothetical protein
MSIPTVSRVSVIGLSLAALSLLLVAPVGCASTAESASDPGAAEPADDGIAEDDADLKGGKLVGTYRIDDSLDPEGMGVFEWIETLALKSDGTFYADEQGVVFDEDGMNSQIGHYEMRGKYTLKRSSDGSKRWISFSYKTPDGKDATSKYFYKAAQGGIRMSVDIRGAEKDSDFILMKLDRTNAWCGEAADCSLQSLPQPKCPGQWKCSKVKPDKVLSYTIDVCRYEGTRCGG